MTAALDGIRVVDLTAGLAGPVAGMLLADLGADVIKIYPPGGGPSPDVPGRHMWDRGKRSAVADPADPADLAALDDLIGRADIVLMGADASGGLVGHADLVARGLAPGQPAFWIVMPPYLLGETPWLGGAGGAGRAGGAGGPGAESAGLLFAWLGHAWNQASYADVPVDCVFPVSLIMQGIWAAITAVALLAGRQLGRSVAPLVVAGGAHGAELVSPGGFAAARAEPHEHRPGGPGGTLANYRCYRCADGRWLFFGAFTNAFIQRGFAAVGAGWILDDPRIAGDIGRVRRGENIGWVTRELERAFAARPRAECLAALDAADCPAAPAGHTADWLDHEQVRAIGLRAELRNDAGEDIVMPGPLIGLSHTPVELRGPAPTRHPVITALDAGWPTRDRAGLGAAATGAAGGGSAGGGTGVPELPLAGLRVLNLGTIIAGPFTATLLGELGAEVWKIERPPHGDEFRTAHGGRGGAGFSVYNRDQRSLLLDLAGGPGGGVFRDLVRSSDVVVDNYRVGVLGRLGIDHDRLAAINPLVTSVSISAFGEAGALAQRPGFDPVVQAMSGIMRGQGGTDEANSPVFLTVPINDVLAGALATLGTCAALFARARIGRGQRITVTLCASSCLLQSPWLVRVPGGAPSEPAGGRDFAGPRALDRLYQGADGWVRLGAQAPVRPAELASAGLISDGTPAGASDVNAATAAGADDAALAAAIAAHVGVLPVAEILARAAVAGIPAVRARQGHELAADDQLIRHGLLSVTERDEAGVSRVLPGRWLEMPGLRREPPGPAPAAGQHADEILAEAGLTPAAEQPSPT
jgi:crotonobetainyl-CoA:carnitine CoA-transferase CaiB-like acyl-CoA transferase